MNENRLIIETRQLCKNFEPTIALNHVDLKLYRGQITGLIGENGSGKSTITSILAGMQPARKRRPVRSLQTTEVFLGCFMR